MNCFDDQAKMTDDMQFEVFSEMQKRGWYEPKPAPQQKVCEACEQFEQKEGSF